MLHKETVSAGTLELIKRLMRDKELNSFILVGGTALSLQLGHRTSIDIDLFSKEGFDAKVLKIHLERTYQTEIRRTTENSASGKIDGVQIDFMTHRYPHVKSPLIEEGIRMASLDDIAAMKFNVITRQPDRLKDFIDLYAMLEHKSLYELLTAYETKYPNVLRAMASNSLLYHGEIDFKTPVNLIGNKPLEWKVIEKRLREAVNNPEKVFGFLNQKQQMKNEQKLSDEVKQDQKSMLKKQEKLADLIKPKRRLRPKK